MRRTLTMLVVGLTPRLVCAHTPRLATLAQTGAMRPLRTVLPAVTCPVQSSLANGWYFRDWAEVHLWRQPNWLVAWEKIWEAARRCDPAFTCAKMF